MSLCESILDKIAEDHFYLIKNDRVASDDSQSILSNTICESESEDSEDMNKLAFSIFERIPQQSDIDYHQNDLTGDFWNAKNGKIVRSVSNIIKG